MPGIVGLITRMPREQAEEQLAKMVAAIRHESFYETGTWVNESLGVYVGWALRKATVASGMPLVSENGDVVLVFSGEEYPDPATPGRLKEQGHEVEPDGCSYLVHLYEEDPAFPAGLNGMFHGLLIDRRQGTATLFNDRYGMHRLYYHESKDGFYFGIEAKAILAVRPELRTPDARGIGEFVACSCVLENRTIFRNIYVLPGGSAWVFRRGAIESRESYFDAREWEEQEPLDADSYYCALRESFAGNLPRYFAGRERIGMTLTGGLDTRLIMAWHKSTPGSLPCYTFGGMFRECQDVRVARRIAALCRQPHEVIGVGSEFLKQFPHYADRSIYLTEGGVDVYRASDLYVSEKARAIAPVKVVGTYGSEIVRGAVMFKAVSPTPGLFGSDFVSYVDQARDTYVRVRAQHPVTFAAFRQSPWYHYGILSLEQTQLSVRSPYLDNAFVRTVFRAPKTMGAGDDIRLRMIGEGSAEMGRIRTDRGFGGSPGPVSNAVRGFQEFTFKAEYAYDYGMPQWISRADHLLSACHFERLFLGRHKLLHFRVWYKNQLADYVREVLLDPRTLSRPHIERKALESVVHGHLEGGLNYTTAIHKLLTLELLYRRFFDPQ
jgi:asparagine synthase (glutamine-hydrolysing)